MRVEMARMPAGRIAANTPPSPALTSFIAVTGSPANMGARATVSVGSLDVTGIDRILWPIQPAEALGPDNLPKPDFRPCHQYLRGIGGNPFLHHSGGLVDEAHHAEEGTEAANAGYGDA
jgi:hypothetical protein